MRFGGDAAFRACAEGRWLGFEFGIRGWAPCQSRDRRRGVRRIRGRGRLGLGEGVFWIEVRGERWRRGCYFLVGWMLDGL